MKEHGMMFSAPMVLAILRGTKTQTRRLATSPLAKRVKPGDRIWVRETFRHWTGSASGKTIVYSADGEWIDWGSGWRGKPEGIQWVTPATPSIHMPRWASRINLRVRDVRFEAVQDISEDDAFAEGIVRMSDIEHGVMGLAESWREHHTAKAAYAGLWRHLHTKDGQRWRDNPRVVVFEFEREPAE